MKAGLWRYNFEGFEGGIVKAGLWRYNFDGFEGGIVKGGLWKYNFDGFNAVTDTHLTKPTKETLGRSRSEPEQ